MNLVILLVILMLVNAVLACVLKDLVSAVIASGIVGLLVSILFYLLHAPDVAMAEASIGTALVIAIFVFAVKKTKRYEEE